MGTDWNAEVVDQVDTHWHGQLRPRLDGLADDELDWLPGVGADVPTIAWRLGHVTAGLAETNGALFGGPPVRFADFVPATTASGLLEQLDHEYATWIDGVRRLGLAGLEAPQGDISPPAYAEAPIARMVLYTTVEVVHHGAEVCLLRDLHRASR